MNKHLVNAITVKTPQNERLSAKQVKNSAGGYVWKIDDWGHLRRFLIIGSEGGTYYVSEKNLTKSGLNTIERCLSLDGIRVVNEILTVSLNNLAPKNDYALFALAAAVAKGDLETKRYALANLNRVARIGTHLFQFAEYLDAFDSLTGRAKRRAFAKWYTDKSPDQLAYQVVKYRNRNNWTHRDILRIAHPGRIVSSGNPSSSVSPSHSDIFKWIVSGWTDENEWSSDDRLSILHGFEFAKRAKSTSEVASLIRQYRLPREAVPTQFLTEKEVWAALLDVGMPLNALVRNLANMTRIELLTSTSDATQTVISMLKNEDIIHNSRIHPLNILFALKTYGSGYGFRGGNTWKPIQTIIDALDSAFYKSFKNVEPTGKRIFIGLDVSGSMARNIFNSNLMCSEATAAMALVTAATENRYEIMGFKDKITNLGISPKMRLDTVVRRISGLTFGGTDCALPMTYAQKHGLEFDAFVVYTDNETWYGNIHPSEALKRYRKNLGIEDAKLVVVGMTSNGFSIADPDDAGMIDVVGFDSSTPSLISSFIRGEI